MMRCAWACLILAAVSCLTPPSEASTAQDYLAQVESARLDPAQCFRVRDLFLEREDVKLYLTDGHLIFAEPVIGRPIAALFIASEETDQGEVLVIPPTAQERHSVTQFTSNPVLNEKFRTAMLFFTDDTAERLHEQIEGNPFSVADAEMGDTLAARWTPVLRNLVETTALRVLVDLFSDLPRNAGFFAATLGGTRLGRFDVVVDPRARHRVSVGQSVWREDRYFFEVWTSFEGRSSRGRAESLYTLPGALEDYRIEATLTTALGMDVVAKATFVPETTKQRVFVLELAEELSISKLLLDGEPAEYLQPEQPASSEARRRQNRLVLLMLPENPAEGARHELEMHYSGRVISAAGQGVYYVGSRGTWYPKGRAVFTNFDLTFHHPAELDLVATGELLESAGEGALRTSWFRTAAPISIAGFNLGHYERASRQVGDFTIEVCANQEAETSLQPQRPAPFIIYSPLPGGSPRPARQRTIIARTPPPPLRPADRLDQVAESAGEALKHLIDWFGDPPVRRVVVSPIPGNFGQGFPGLVYASTLSYFRPEDPPLASRTPSERVFYAELLMAHEISHQWWGNVVTVKEDSDTWLMEGLATYSALMLLEQRNGKQARDEVLAIYKQGLLEQNEDGKTVESAGPIVLGSRLRSSQFPQAAQVVMYEKGAWILHMLRGIMGDEGFLAFLRDLRNHFEFGVVTTEDFRQEAARHLPENWPDPDLMNFFDQWVYGTGIPRYSIEYSTQGREPRLQFRARLRQQGVAEHFSAAVPVLIETLPGRSTLEHIRTNGPVSELNVVLRNRPSRVVVDPEQSLLAVIE